MLIKIVTLIFIVLSEVKSDHVSEATWRDMNRTVIKNIEEYCQNRNCLVKCCPDGHIISLKKENKKHVWMCRAKRVSYAEFNKFIKSDKSLMVNEIPYFHMVQNDLLSDPNKTIPRITKDVVLFKDGSMNSSFESKSRLTYCVDLIKTRNNSYRLIFKLAADPENPDATAKQLFVAIGMLISSFFMFLVLMVYVVLPQLRNLAGMTLMSYLLSLIVGYILKALQLIDLTYPHTIAIPCHTISRPVYFFLLSGFLWVNIMSFDVWWTFRGERKCLQIHSRGIRMKFLWYCVYAWGIPALMTIVTVIIDKHKLYHDQKYSPPFNTCFADVIPTIIYLHVPIAITSVTNCILFALTAYNIWLMERSIANHTGVESRNTKNEKNRFAVYGKLFILMGVTWLLELIPSVSLPVHIILNSVNVFLGVIIFYIFVCKKRNIKRLCKRFNIGNHADRFMDTETEYAKSGRKSRSSHKPHRQTTEMTTFSTEIS